MKQTPLYKNHIYSKAQMINYHGWNMPLNYGSQLNEHHQVRNNIGMFDLSHMTIIDLNGNKIRDFLSYLLSKDINKLSIVGQAFYTSMLNHKGGIIDDLIVYYISEKKFRFIVNASTATKDIEWINYNSKLFKVSITVRSDLGIISIQGPKTRKKTNNLFQSIYKLMLQKMKPFHSVQINDLFIATTGYTGEDGYEILVPNTKIVDLWNRLLELNIPPCGLGARNTLRLEAGMNLYGKEMNENITPFSSNMNYTITWEPKRDFIGRKALETIRINKYLDKLVGLITKEKLSILRDNLLVYYTNKLGIIRHGIITSGSFSPTLNYSIALARVPYDIGNTAQVLIRKQKVLVTVTTPDNFIRINNIKKK